jgi:hypothetical protein
MLLLVTDLADASLYMNFDFSLLLLTLGFAVLLLLNRLEPNPIFFFRCLIRFRDVLLQSTASSQYPPLPFSFLSRATFEKKKLSDKLCRMEF